MCTGAQVLGLGDLPNQVVFTGDKGVHALQGSLGHSLMNFWRGAENFRTTSKHKWEHGAGMLWSVSQAAPLRRIIVDHDLIFSQYGYSSGGFSADMLVQGLVHFGTQQQVRAWVPA